MRMRTLIGLLAAMIFLVSGRELVAADKTYPDWSGAWNRIGSGSFDGVTPSGPTEKAPLTPEYRARWVASMEAQKKTGVSGNPVERCLPPGMPRSMIVLNPMEIIITPKTTYMLLTYLMEVRRIYTDGRKFPAQTEPTFSGYSIGAWEDSDNDGSYDTLNIETRFLKGPRSYGTSGIPFHDDGKTVVKERIYLDKSKPGVMVNEITTFDNALTEPWAIKRNYRFVKDHVWEEFICVENNNWVIIGGENYYLAADGLLMPAVKGQAPPDLRYFGEQKK
jgi:hypothetical protein